MLRATANTLAEIIGGASFPKSWKEMLDYKPETRTAEEIEDTIVSKLQALGGT